MMVVGNKADMKKRVVSKQEGQTLANEFGAGFLEISVSGVKWDLKLGMKQR